MVLVLLTSIALADDPTVSTFEVLPVAGHEVFDFRVGVTNDNLHPFVCAEIYPLAWLSVEGCGTGSGVLHNGDEADMAHFRTRFTPVTHQAGRWSLAGLVGVGFAEVQSGRDQAGFKFGKADTAEPVEAAGAELSVGAKGRYWMHNRAYATTDVSAGAAYIPAAPDVIGRGGPVVPFVSATVGLGF
jgi:hypothetical protein